MSDSDLTDAEISAATRHLVDLLRIKGNLGGCISYVQRKMDLRWNHARRLIESLEAAQVITRPSDLVHRQPFHNWPSKGPNP